MDYGLWIMNKIWRWVSFIIHNVQCTHVLLAHFLPCLIIYLHIFMFRRDHHFYVECWVLSRMNSETNFLCRIYRFYRFSLYFQLYLSRFRFHMWLFLLFALCIVHCGVWILEFRTPHFTFFVIGKHPIFCSWIVYSSDIHV